MKSKMEQIWVVISILSEKYLVCCIYKPPDFTEMIDLCKVFRKIKDYADRKCFKDILRMGDFNYPEVVWTNGIISMINSESLNVRNFCEIVNESYVIQHVCFPNFQMANGTNDNTFDLIFTTEESSVFELRDIGILGDIRNAHLIIKFKWCLNKRKEVCLRERNIKFAYKRGNYSEMSRSIDKINWRSLLLNKSVQDIYDLLIICLPNECNTHIPKTRTHPKNTNHIWIDENLKQLVRQKKNLRYTNCASGWKNPDMIRKYY
jgi:hypothetical protein